MEIRSTPGLSEMVYSGNPEALRSFLGRRSPDIPLHFAEEPYCVIQGRKKKECLQILCDDRRLVFDDLFVVRQLYFSTRECHEVILSHPRLQILMKGKKSIFEYGNVRFQNFHGYDGMRHRYIQANRMIRKRAQNFRVTFYLYPFLVLATRAWIERHYAPGAPGYLRMKKQWDLSSAALNTK